MNSLSTPEPVAPGARERILLAAMELFRRYGFNNTSISQILQSASITKGGFYFHFKSKEELGFAVLEFAKNFWMEKVIAVIKHEPDVKSRIRRMVEIMTQMNRGEIYHGCALLAVLTAEMMETESEFTERIKGIFDEWQKSIVDILEQGKAEGLFRKGMDSKALAFTLIGCCQGTTMMGHLDPKRVNFDLLLHDLERWILEGVTQ